MKILYAANDRIGAGLQFNRIFSFIKDKHTVKLAAFRGSYDKDIDWNLSALFNINNQKSYNILNNDILNIYVDQIKYFNPDLIISDLELFTSFAAAELNIKIWQVSPLLLQYGLHNSWIRLRTKYSKLFDQDLYELTKNILFNSDKNLIYSYFCDTNAQIKLKPGYEWVRPYHILGEQSNTCRHNITACLFNNDKQIINLLQKYKDVVLFTNFTQENYDNIILKNSYNISEYACNLKNSSLFICQGETDLLADAWYNNIPCLMVPNLLNKEHIINSTIIFKFNLSNVLYDTDTNISKLIQTTCNYNDKIKFLHEKLEEF